MKKKDLAKKMVQKYGRKASSGRELNDVDYRIFQKGERDKKKFKLRG